MIKKGREPKVLRPFFMWRNEAMDRPGMAG
jgi:hypothetical protein